MRSGRVVTVTVAAVMSLMATMISASTAMATDQSVQQIIQNKTGATASPMTAPQQAGDISIGTGRSAGKALESYTQTPDAKSTRVLTVVADASQSVVTYPVTSPAGTRVEPQTNGSVDLVQDVTGPPADQSGTFTTSATVTTIHTPWAVDASGKSLPTTYTFANGVLTQKINTTGAAFPVVADPWVTGGWFDYVHFSRNETFQIYNGWKLGTPVEVAGLCVLMGPIPGIGFIMAVGCGFVMLRAIADINVTVWYAVHNYNKRLVIKLLPFSPYYFGSYAEYSP
jgi:hypothetical protein